MKAMILAGGLGTRLAEETTVRPKPLVTIGGHPIIWHVMKTYAHHGIHDFIVCLGYRGHLIREYFLSCFHRNADLTIDLSNNGVTVHRSRAEPWRVTLADTGASTMTGGRVKRAAQYLGDDEVFCLTYADGVSDVNIGELVRSHHRQSRLVTVTAVRPPDRFGRLGISDSLVTRFEEKPPTEDDWVNAGYFVVSRKALNVIDGDTTAWEREPMQRLVADGQLSVHRHQGFWRCMDTMQDRQTLEQLWEQGVAPWKVWDDASADAPTAP